MSQRVERVSGELRAMLGEMLARDEVKDPRVRGAGLITVTHVRVSGDLQHARAFFTVHGLDGPALERVRAGLDSASGYFRQAIGRRLRIKMAPAITFEVDKIFEQAARVEQILHEVAPPPPPAAPAGDQRGADDAPGSADEPADED